MIEIDPHKAVEYIFDNAPEYAKAKGRLAELEVFKSSLKAILMKNSYETAIGAQEREAYADPKYQELAKAIGETTEQAELLKYRLESAKLRIEVWRTQEANNRNIDKLTK
jgi:hypothetical protein